ncbi:MAG TPA: DMT family transporter [Anaeromyxobacteraceae bacterium]|nr:DMT family transporter [Anaeromyxobacteraceae bacterium]
MSTSRSTLEADGLLLLTAAIWGFAFVAQRSGMAVIGPFAYGAARFALGAASLVPLLVVLKRRRSAAPPRRRSLGFRVRGAGLAGLVLFAAASLQQVGLVHTTAANAGFITCLYVILVPIVGALLGRASGARIWAGASLALAGLYVLSVGDGLSMAWGDLLVLGGAFFWTGHILLITWLAARMEALEIAFGQFVTCAALSLITALMVEPRPFAGVVPAAVPILYGGLLSIGVAYTLQVVAQRTAHPAHASIIMSMEALFAGIGGVLILREPLTARLAAGGALMLAGMIVSQLERRRARVIAAPPTS